MVTGKTAGRTPCSCLRVVFGREKNMLERRQLLALPFYEKEKFKGSIQGMCYMVEGRKMEVMPTEEELAENPKKKPSVTWKFVVTVWPGPLSFEKTPAGLKQIKEYPERPKLTEEDLVDITAYLNEQYEEQKPLWDTVRYF